MTPWFQGIIRTFEISLFPSFFPNIPPLKMVGQHLQTSNTNIKQSRWVRFNR